MAVSVRLQSIFRWQAFFCAVAWVLSSPASGGNNCSLTLQSPPDGATIDKPLIVVSGIATAGAVVTVSGAAVAVSGSGAFSKEVNIPDEEGRVSIEVEARLGADTARQIRTVVYKPPQNISLNLDAPAENELVCALQVQVSGRVRPDNAEVTIGDKTVRASSGRFQQVATVGPRPGAYTIVVKVSAKGSSQIFRRQVRYSPAKESKCNTDAPKIQPASLPPVSQQKRLMFAVFDPTPYDTITFHTSVDGTADRQCGVAGGQFFLDLEDGAHDYKVWAEDAAGNKSPVLAAKVSYLSKMPYLTIRKPHDGEVVAMGEDNESPTVTVDFSVANLPDDDPHLLKQVKVTNQATGKTVSQSRFTDVDFSIDVDLKRGRNPIVIEVLTVTTDTPVSQTVNVDAR